MQPRRHVPLSRLTSLLVSCALLASTAAPPAGATSSKPGARTLAAPSSAKSAARRRGATYRAGQFIVRFREDVAESERAALAASEGASRQALRGGSGAELWSLTQGKDVEATVAALSSRPAIEFAEPNYLITADQFTPSDTRFPEQWALRNAGQAGGEAGSDIGVIRAWAKATGSPRTVVAVIDGGVDFSHPDLANNRWTNPADPANGQDDGGDGFVDDLSGWDWISNSGVVTDPAGHGTAVAGLIAAEGNNLIGTAGVMWSASVMSLRVLDERGAGDVASVVEAIDYASARGAHVVNCSWGTDAESRALSEAVARAGRRGSLVVAPAGNDSRNIDAAPRYPAAFDLPNVVAVAATNNFDQLTPWSNWGAGRAHVAAPGTDLLSTAPGGGYRAVSGTSAAAALVAGVAGLVRTIRPGFSPRRTRDALVRGARPASGLAGRVAAGGVVSAAGALGVLDTLPPGEGDGDESGGAGGKTDEQKGGDGQAGAPSESAPSTASAHGASGGRPPEGVRGRPAANLPDLDEAKRHRPAKPQAPPPVPSTLRNCPPHNPRCNGEAGAARTSSEVSSAAGAGGRVFVAAAGYRLPPLGVARDLSLADHVRNVAGTPDAGDAPFLGLPGLYAKAAGLLPALFVAPAQGANGAAFFSQSVPTTMSAGQTYNVSVTMTNTGQTTWSAANSHRLGSQTPTDNTVWRLSRVQLPTSVLPGEKVTIPFTVTAPTVAKSYTFQWRMVQDGVEWFGQATAPVAVTVNAPDFEGEFESASCSEIRGWAWDLRRPNTPVEVDVFKVESGNEIFLARVLADQYRPSLGRGDNRHGFSLPAPAAIRDGGGPHSIRVRYANTSFQSPAPAELSGSTREVTGCAALPNATAPPASLVTWHASNTLIRLSWTPAAGATHYRVERATVKSGPFQFAGVASGTGHDDAGRTQGVAYLYRVCSSDSSGGACVSPYSNVALGTAFSFTDPTLQAGVTPVRKEHVNELRQTVDSVRAAAELNAASWGAPVAVADPIRAAHIRDLRARLAEALTALDILPPAYTDPTLFEQVTVVRKAHVEDLRLRSTLASGTVSGQPAQQASAVAPAARLEPRNRTGVGGVDLLSGNFNWSLPLVSLRGRAGLDLGLALSYNSLVWTRQGAAVHFNADEGYPAPGFRLGFPVIQPQYYNAGRGTNAYLLVTPGGSRVELRQTPEGHYESDDSSHLKLYAFGGGLMQLRTTDGTLITFMARGHSHYVWEIRDRNGNRLSANHDSAGRLLSVTDTLARVINFNYDANRNLLSITQQRNGQQHAWATFGYGAAAVGAGAFGPAVTLSGAEAGRPVNVLTRVGLADGSGYRFEYNDHAQVRKISRRSADDHELAYTAYDYEPAADDCPRVAAGRVWALDWNDGHEAVTSYARDGAGAWGEAVMPDATRYRELYATSGWRAGLTTGTESYAGGIKQKWTAVEWAQDDESLTYRKNPRVKESSVHDKEGNARRTEIDYHPATYYPGGKDLGLAKDVKEYGAGAQANTVLRRTRTEYNLSAEYMMAGVVGLVSERYVYGRVASGGEELFSKVTYSYDETSDGRLAPTSTAATPTQHDSAYAVTDPNDPQFRRRGNLTSVKRWSVKGAIHPETNPELVETKIGYNTTGSVVFSLDAAGRRSESHYADSFVDGAEAERALAFGTFAYPTAIRNAGNFTTTVRYDYDTGAIRQARTPHPDGTSGGPVQTTRYDAAGRVERVFNSINGAYTRYVYGPGQTWVQSFATLADAAAEAYSIQVFDGAGRPYASASEFPGGAAPYRGRHTVYDALGRAVRSSNPAAMTSAWEPVDEDAADAVGAGWYYATQDYDWQGRPTNSTTVDGGFARELIYGGCGCAGGEVTTVRDALGRRQEIGRDVLGRVRTMKHFDGATLYTTTVNEHDALDRVTRVRQYEGAEGGAAFRESTAEYDGHGRLSQQRSPMQTAASEYTYFKDDAIREAKDARGAKAVYSYGDPRGLLTGVSYAKPANVSEEVVPTEPAVAFGYDAAGNRQWMTDGLGRVDYVYDALSRLTSEARTFGDTENTSINGVVRTVSYAYHASGALKSVTDPFGARVDYGYDRAGQLTGVTGSPYSTGGTSGDPVVLVSEYARDLKYRAWGALREMTYGNGLRLSQSYTARLKLDEFKVDGRNPAFGASVVMRWKHQYYNDGALKAADNLLDDKFDRAYKYDHAGRLEEAFSGAQALSFVATAPSNNVPYWQRYHYDAWGGLTKRENHYWSNADTFLATYDAGGRRSGIDYDADGRATNDGSLLYTHDAAGRNRVATDNSAVWIRQRHDGDGQVMKRVEERHGDDGQAGDTATVYYVRSSALGGRVVSEVDENASKVKTNVYAGGQVVAELTQNRVAWQHASPLTGNRGVSGTNGGYAEEALEFDPQGVNVGKHQPVVLGQPAPEAEPVPNLVADLPLGRCRLEGMAIDCAWAAQMRETGASVMQAPSEMTAPIYSRSKGRYVGVSVWDSSAAQKGVALFGVGSAGFLPAGVRYDAATGFSGSGWGQWVSYVEHAFRDDWTEWGYTDARGESYSFARNDGGFVPAAWQQQPQNHPIVPLPDLKTGIEEALSDLKCANYIDRLLSRVAYETKRSPLDMSLSDIFSLASFTFAPPLAGPNSTLIGGGRARGSIEKGTAEIHIHQMYAPYGEHTPAEEIKRYQDIYIHNALHEAIHLAARGGGGGGIYNDRALASAAFNLMDKKSQKANPLPAPNSSSIAFSTYWDSQLSKYCK